MTPAALDAALSAAERESLSHLEFLHRLLAEPAETRRQRAVDRRLRAAKFRELTTLEGFDWAFNAKGVDRRTVEQLATCDFVRRRENVILVGRWDDGTERAAGMKLALTSFLPPNISSRPLGLETDQGPPLLLPSRSITSRCNHFAGTH